MSFEQFNGFMPPAGWMPRLVKDIAYVNENSIKGNSQIDTINYIDIAAVNNRQVDKVQLLKLQDAPSRARRIVKDKDILISTVRPNLKHYTIIRKVEKNTIASTGFAVISPKIVQPEFLYYFLTADSYTRYLSQIAEGQTSAYPAFNPDIIENTCIYLPPDDEQVEIGELLSSFDRKIELNNSINKNLEEMAQALFKRWFLDFEFPNENGEPYKSSGGEFEESEFGLTPKNWSLKSIYDMASYINGASFKANELGEDGIPVIKIAELKGGITSQTKYFQGSEKDGKYYINNGDVLFSWSGNPETSIDTFIWYKGKGILNQHIFKVVPYNHNLKGYVYTLLKYMKSTFARLAGGKQTTGLGHVTVKDLQRLQVVFPDEVTLSSFSKTVDPIIQQIYNNNLENEILSSTRDALLPKLMSGEIRVQVDREYSKTHKNDQPMAAESKEHYSII